MAAREARRHASRELRGLVDHALGRRAVGGEEHGDPTLEAACVERLGVIQVVVLSEPFLEPLPVPAPEAGDRSGVHGEEQPSRVAVHLAGKLHQPIDEDRGDGAGRDEHVAVDGPAPTLAPRLDPRPRALDPEAEKGPLVR